MHCLPVLKSECTGGEAKLMLRRFACRMATIVSRLNLAPWRRHGALASRQRRTDGSDAGAGMGCCSGSIHCGKPAQLLTARGPGKEPGQQAHDQQLPRERHDPEAGPQVKPLLIPASQLP